MKVKAKGDWRKILNVVAMKAYLIPVSLLLERYESFQPWSQWMLWGVGVVLGHLLGMTWPCHGVSWPFFGARIPANRVSVLRTYGETEQKKNSKKNNSICNTWKERREFRFGRKFSMFSNSSFKKNALLQYFIKTNQKISFLFPTISILHKLCF